MNLFYRKYGEGKPVIILHGLFGMSDNWATFGKKIAEKNYCVYIPDQRNHGESPHSDAFGTGLLADDLGDFISQHNLENPVIIGHSMGGRAAMQYALKYDDRPCKLIIVDIGVKNYRVHDEEIIEALYNANIEKAASRQEIEAYLQTKIPDRRVLQLMMKNVKRNENNVFEWKLNVKGIKQNFTNIFDAITTDKPYPEPVLFIRGGLSNYIKDGDIAVIKAIFPAARIETIAAASHWVHVDSPDEFMQTVLMFIENPKE